MRRIALGSTLCLSILSLPVMAAAGIALSPIMNAWNADRHRIDAMLTGRRPYDEAALRAAVSLYIQDATTVAGRIRGRSDAARDFAHRFDAFAADGRRAMGSVGEPVAFRVLFGRMTSDCQSCHAIFNN
jgi:cytochrome c556